MEKGDGAQMELNPTLDFGENWERRGGLDPLLFSVKRLDPTLLPLERVVEGLDPTWLLLEGLDPTLLLTGVLCRDWILSCCPWLGLDPCSLVYGGSGSHPAPLSRG